MEDLKTILNIANIGFVLLAAWYMTQRVYPPLQNLQNIFGVKHKQKLKNSVDALSQLDVSHDPQHDKMKVEVCDAFLALYDNFGDNETSVADAVKRTKKGIVFLFIALILQSLLILIN